MGHDHSFNSLSRCPVLTVPTGRASNGVPTSLQIVGRTYSDKDVFQAGLAYETAAPQWFNGKNSRPDLALAKDTLGKGAHIASQLAGAAAEPVFVSQRARICWDAANQ